MVNEDRFLAFRTNRKRETCEFDSRSIHPCSAVLVHVGTVDGSTAQLRDA
jgi:hypothetical protein